LDPRDFLVRRVYDGLMNDSKGRGSSKNGALFLENLALEANWPGPLKKPAAKKFVNEFVASRRVSELADGFKEMSTLRNMSNWVEKERFGLPEYLLRACPASLREGRRLKTKFRLGCHDLRSSSSRTQLVRNAQCPCCASRESETIQHTLFECEAFEEEREAFLARLYSVCPPARQLTDEGRCRLVMGDESSTAPACSSADTISRSHTAPKIMRLRYERRAPRFVPVDGRADAKVHRTQSLKTPSARSRTRP
jgi:hypothetical protein